tara:strand:+ start:131 stop:373 length:243 start_codon:yes stop_codon:yes gene_type:complete
MKNENERIDDWTEDFIDIMAEAVVTEGLANKGCTSLGMLEFITAHEGFTIPDLMIMSPEEAVSKTIQRWHDWSDNERADY